MRFLAWLSSLGSVFLTLFVFAAYALTIASTLYGASRIFPEYVKGKMIYVLSMLILTGAFGGLTRGLVDGGGRFRFCSFETESKYHFNLGSLSEIIIGIIGPLGIFFVFANFFQIKLEDVPNHLQLIALGVLAGYFSRSVLETLRRELLNRLEGRIKQTEGKLEESLKTDQGLALATAKVAFDAQDYQTALDVYEGVLKGSPDNVRALIGQGACIIRVKKGTPEAIQIALKNCNRIIEELDPQEEVAWYNRACYRCMLGEPEAAILNDLRRSVALNPATFGSCIEQDVSNGGNLARVRSAILQDDVLKGHAPYRLVEGPVNLPGS